MNIQTLLEKYKLVFDSMEDETGMNEVEKTEELDENLLDKKPNIDQAIYDEIKEKQPEVAQVNDRIATKILKQFEALNEISLETAQDVNIQREQDYLMADAKAKNGTEEDKEKAEIAAKKLEKSNKLFKKWKKAKGIQEAVKFPKALSSIVKKCWAKPQEEQICTLGKWKIALGGYDKGYELYYNNEPILSISPDNEVKMYKSNEDTKALCKYGYMEIMAGLNDVEPALKLIANESINEAKQITKDEWNKTHDDYKMMKNGKPYLVYLDPESHATVLGPVEIIDETKTVSISKVEQTILDAIKKHLDDPDLMEYVSVEGSERDLDGRLLIQVRAELDYEGMVKLADKLNKIIQKYDKEAYFDQAEPGVMEAVLDAKITEAANVGKQEVVAKFDNGKHQIVKCAEGYFNQYNIKNGKPLCNTKCVKTLPTAIGALKRRFPKAEQD